MKALEIEYQGQGSEKQITWATDIFNKEMEKVAEVYKQAQLRVQNKTMPEKWINAWNIALNDSRVIKMVEMFANQPASATISFKGLKTARGTVSVVKIIEKTAIEIYNK